MCMFNNLFGTFTFVLIKTTAAVSKINFKTAAANMESDYFSIEINSTSKINIEKGLIAPRVWLP